MTRSSELGECARGDIKQERKGLEGKMDAGTSSCVMGKSYEVLGNSSYKTVSSGW